MPGSRGLVVVHVDGLSHARLLEAIERGHMPFVANMIRTEGYEALAYRCGVPSTTPFAQAGVLFGDNSEIPSYRWWDKPTDALIAFGEGSTFDLVADRYFKGREALTKGGACIAALYRAGATDRFGPHYRERHRPDEHDAGGRAIVAFLLNPVTLYFWIRHGGLALFRIARDYLRARFAGRRPANRYVIADIYHEVLVHHLTRFALLQAMGGSLPVIYACFYTCDEAAHAFGPTDPNTLAVLRHIDSTIRLAAQRREGRYELVVLSDHGQVETTPVATAAGTSVGRLLGEWLPEHTVTEHRGGVFGAPGGKRVEVTYSGGLAHVYFLEFPQRLDRAQVEAAFPGLIGKLAAVDQIGVVMTAGTLTTAAGDFPLGERLSRDTATILSRFDDPDILARQLRRLNSFERAGDLALFGAYDGDKQINFEAQVGGHGSIGGQQLHPFVLAKREWGFDTSAITNASELHPLLVGLRDGQ